MVATTLGVFLGREVVGLDLFFGFLFFFFFLFLVGHGFSFLGLLFLSCQQNRMHLTRFGLAKLVKFTALWKSPLFSCVPITLPASSLT